MRESPIFIIDTDAAKLRGLLASRTGARVGRDHEHLFDLAAELERAFVVDAGAVPSGVVTLNSLVHVTDLLTGDRRALTLVFPSEADPAAGRVSVLAPLGCALVGCREGERVEWEMPGGLRRLRIDKVTAPEAPPARRGKMRTPVAPSLSAEDRI
jgi:regulator of nucleoside diphosphate kinase